MFNILRCENPFPTGERVTFTGKNCLCQKCIQSEREGEVEPALPTVPAPAPAPPPLGEDQCAGCRQELKDGQALVALDKQYHIWCFKCTGQSSHSHTFCHIFSNKNKYFCLFQPALSSCTVSTWDTRGCPTVRDATMTSTE